MMSFPVYFTIDGTPVTELFLHGNVQRLNGTFIPVASPVSRDNRLYLMTEFVPETVQPNKVTNHNIIFQPNLETFTFVILI